MYAGSMRLYIIHMCVCVYIHMYVCIYIFIFYLFIYLYIYLTYIYIYLVYTHTYRLYLFVLFIDSNRETEREREREREGGGNRSAGCSPSALIAAFPAITLRGLIVMGLSCPYIHPKGPKDPIIRYFGCGLSLSRLIFGRVYDY